MASPRDILEETLEGIWKKPEFKAIRETYDRAAGSKRESGSFGQCLAELMEKGIAGRDAYRECAEKTKLGEEYANAWK